MAKKGIPTDGIALLAAYPGFRRLVDQRRPLDDVARQLERVHVPSQILHGAPDHFRFMAYPLPRLTFKERQDHPLFPEKTVEIGGNSWKVRIDIDIFGHINWFYVDGIPELYWAIEPYMPMGE